MAKKFTVAQSRKTAKIQGGRVEAAKSINSASIVAPSLKTITDNTSTVGIREAAKVLDSGRIRSRLGKDNGLTGQPANGGSTGNLLKEITTPGFDHGGASGDHLAENPRNQPGDGIANLTPAQKDLMGALEVVAGGIAGLAMIVAATGAAPVLAPALAIGATVSAVGFGVMEKVGTPNPEDITGGTPGVTITGKGVGFDPITGLGPSKNEKLGLFTGDETGGSGVILTREEARNFKTALSGAQGSFHKNPSPLDESSNFAVLDDRTGQRIEMILAGGGAAGPIVSSSLGISGAQNLQHLAIAVDAILA